ncbi:PaaI family thioesterase [Tsukamurella tyrosinosolvens]|uniref:PaaI family thioesterase n=1 Tax=Tsukamurella tyrosinosolvens TaxID=57704 RepID=UPI002DD43E20|nr:PaaI family thioesterase [Tsukamurella tyrosinosolvens]MEC4614015.1 PaaI family thioesterase [Tsukamurella tyrosinosolvens]
MTFDRQGILWDAINGRTPPSPAAELLAWTFRAVDPDAGTLEVGFALDERFTNPVGSIQGGFVAAMLDDTLGPALVATLEPNQFAPTVSLTLQYLAPALPGEFVGYGRVVKKGREIAFLEGYLVDAKGTTVATAAATSVIRTLR